MEPQIISIRKNPEYAEEAVAYLQAAWPVVYPPIYEDSMKHCLRSSSVLPQWYLLKKGEKIIGCAGLITNDFISRMDLYPWVCALFIEKESRGNAYGALLLEKAKEDSRAFGFRSLYLCTEHIGYYEKYGFEYIGQGYHPWEEESRMYQIEL